MRVYPLLLTLFCLLAGCGASGAGSQYRSTTGTIEFGATQRNHVVQHPTTVFGPDDTFAYVAHVAPRRAIAAHAKITELFFTRSSDGTEHTVMTDSFRLKIQVSQFVTLNSIPIASLYAVGFKAPGTYHIRLLYDGEPLAEGTFALR